VFELGKVFEPANGSAVNVVASTWINKMLNSNTFSSFCLRTRAQ